MSLQRQMAESTAPIEPTASRSDLEAQRPPDSGATKVKSLQTGVPSKCSHEHIGNAADRDGVSLGTIRDPDLSHRTPDFWLAA
jgi:hypothetical protein